MNADCELLNYIYQNSQMGCDTLEQIMETSDDAAFKSCLKRQQEGYQKFHSEARDRLQKQGASEKGLSFFEKARTSMMVNLQTMSDKSTPHLAEMLIQGTSMGITESARKTSEYQDQADRGVVHMMKELQHFEEQCIDDLKSWL